MALPFFVYLILHQQVTKGKKRHMSDSNIPPLWLQVPEPRDLVRKFGTAVDVPAFGGRLEVDWSPGERVTSVRGLVYFATFLKETGRFDRLCKDFPISYKSNNSSSKRDIVGTAVLAILLARLSKKREKTPTLPGFSLFSVSFASVSTRPTTRQPQSRSGKQRGSAAKSTAKNPGNWGRKLPCRRD